MENEPQNQFGIPPVIEPNTLSQPQPTKPKIKLWKKILLILVVLIVAAGTGFYFLPSILTLLYPGDAALIDNSQLTMQKVSVPDQDNGFYDLSKITAAMINVPMNDQDVPFDLEYTDSTKPVQWDQQLVDQVLNQNQQALSLFDAASSKSYIQVPDFADPAKVNLNTPISPLNSWRGSARLQAIKALSLSFQGKPDDALQAAVKINRVAHNLIVGHNSLIGTLVGIAMQQLGSQTILRILPYNNPSKSSLETLSESIYNDSDNLEGYRNAYRFEYLNITSAMDTLSSQLKAGTQQIVEDGNVSAQDAKYVRYGYYYKPNQTKNLYTDLYNTEVSAVGNKCQLLDLDASLTKIQNQIVNQDSSWRVVFVENAIGKILFTVSGVTLGSALTKECQNDLISNVAQTEIALRVYKMDKGQLPGALNELVPEYLTSVPVDPYDHQPIRYSPTKKFLYSVGLKNQDLGGSTGNDWTKMDNPTFQINF